jgi:hypothetical protein
VKRRSSRARVGTSNDPNEALRSFRKIEAQRLSDPGRGVEASQRMKFFRYSDGAHQYRRIIALR